MAISLKEFDPLHVVLPSAIESERLLLRCYRKPDADGLEVSFKVNQQRLREDFPGRVQGMQSRGDVESFIVQVRQLWDRREAFHLGIWEKRSGDYVGEVSFASIAWSIPRSDISYFLVEGKERKGLMTEGLKATLPFAFDVLQMNKLQIRCALNNLRSQSVAGRAGFRIEGVLRNDLVRPDGYTLVDLVYYGMTSEDFSRLYRRPA